MGNNSFQLLQSSSGSYENTVTQLVRNFWWVYVLIMTIVFIWIVSNDLKHYMYRVHYNQDESHPDYYYQKYLVPKINSRHLTAPQVIDVIPDEDSVLNEKTMTLNRNDVELLIQKHLDSVQNLNEYQVNYYIFKTKDSPGDGKYYNVRYYNKVKLYSGVIVLTRLDSGIKLYPDLESR